MPPHIQRIMTEANELLVKLNKLIQFIETDVFHDLEFQDKAYLRMQMQIMQAYYSILQIRITRSGEFPTPEPNRL